MPAAPADPEYTIRPATVDDVPVLARHRCEMFKDMGNLTDAAYPELAAAAARYFATAIPAGTYKAWLVAPAGQPARIVAGGGLQLRQMMPRPDRDGVLLTPGPQGLVVNVYTDPDWRQRGLGELVMRMIIAWCRDNGVVSLVLHASSMGRPLYERLGFEATNEMSFPL